ncbi:hypothetical protein FQN57_001458 [Myotisia sp. PD_48]|nr:hypothetical protein FQN57_001458 [Myotisia sp. PD_48]
MAATDHTSDLSPDPSNLHASSSSSVHNPPASYNSSSTQMDSTHVAAADGREKHGSTGELLTLDGAAGIEYRPGPAGMDLEGKNDPGPPKNPMDPSSFPEGGLQAWTVVFGGFCSLFVSFGWINCIGIFQDYYQTHQLSHLSSSTVAWITSLETCMMFVVAPICGKLFDNYGPRYILIAGTFLHIFGLMMTSLATEYYQFVLAQGICSPIGAGFLFYPTTNSLVTWFLRRRALALGIVVSGSSLGGVILPIMVNHLIPQVGFAWAMRICAFLMLGLCIIACLTVKSRIPPTPKPLRPLEFLRPYKELPFVLIAVACFLFFFGMFLPFTFIVLHSKRYGMSKNLSNYMVSILNAASIFGRTFPGWAADRFGRFNIMFVMTLFTSLTVFALWIPSRGNAANIVFAVLYGFGSGTFVSLPPSLVAHISDVRQIGVRTGTLFASISIAALLGSPIGGALVPDVVHGSYWRMQLFAGAVMFAGSIFFLLVRIRLGGTKLTTKI